MKRTVEEIRNKIGRLACDNETALELCDEVERLMRHVADLQSGMYVNCVYCGHRYGPRENTPVAMADILREHIEQCSEHPLSHVKAKIRQLTRLLPDPRQMSGWDDAGCPVDVAVRLIELAEVLDIEVPSYLYEILSREKEL